MLDEEKDLFIKKKFQQDKTISNKANDIFKNFENQILTSDENKSKETLKDKPKEEPKVIEFKTHSLFSRIKSFTAVAASFVVAVSVGAGAAIYGNVSNKNANTNSEYSTVNINDSATASDYVVAEVKNEEIKVEEIKEKKSHENKYVKTTLMTDGSVAIQLKQEFMKTYKIKLDASKTYKVSGIKGSVKDVFACSMISEEYPYVLLLMDDGTVEVIQVINENATYTDEYKFDFFDQGKIDGLRDVVGFETKTEKLVDSNKLYYYVNAIKKDGTRKIIDDITRVNMNDVSNNTISFRSQDGEKTFSINADKDNYVQGFGWAGASNNVYYINDNCLYHKNLTDGKEEKLITGAKSIYVDEDGIIIVKVKFNHCIHENNQYIKIEAYNVTEAKVVDKQENENYIVCLKEDGSITIELKDGAKDRLDAKEYIKEKYIYNFYAGKCSVQVYNQYSNYDPMKQGVNSYANATAIYLGKIGTTGKTCLAYATKNKDIIMINIDLFVKTGLGGSFESEPGTRTYVYMQGTTPSIIKELNEKKVSAKSEKGDTKECFVIEATNQNGMKSVLPVGTVLVDEGNSNYTIDYNE